MPSPSTSIPSGQEPWLQQTGPAPWQALWQQSWAGLGLQPEADLLPQLLAAYGQPQRHYHGLQHLHECLWHWQQVQHLADRPTLVALALWFHDAVYDPQAKDNELRSAQWAMQALQAAGAPAAMAEQVQALIMATCHTAQPAPGDARLVVDIDLAILGAAPARFAQYQWQVRQEYGWVPEAQYRQGRRAVLQGFAQRAAIYGTPWFQARLETRARANLAQSLAELDGVEAG